MKELIIVITILVLAFVIYLFMEGSNISFAGMINALKFDFTNSEPQAEEKTEENQNIETKENKTESSSSNTVNMNKASQEYEKENEKQNSPQPGNVQTASQTSGLSPLSPYYQKIRISNVKKEAKSNPSLITLRVYAKEEIDITGFKIKTRHGEFAIPKGIEKYQSHKSGKDIVVDGYMYVYIVGSPNPLGSIGFRINKCFGYLKEYNKFYPSFYSYCPSASKEELYNLSPVCQDYILKSAKCETPDYSNNLKIAANSSCVNYINENLNYSGCFKNYSGDDDFLKNYWYLYTGSNIVEPLHDIVYLYDSRGYLVDKYSY